MNNNEVMRSIWQVLRLSDTAIADIFKLAQQTVDPALVSNLQKDPHEPGFVPCTDQLMSSFLDGLITHRRGKSDKKPEVAPNNGPLLNNNLILKKLRIAFDLQEDDLLELLSLAEYDTSRSELGAIFRKPGNKHYRECSDDFLMAFLVGLSYREWN